MNNKYVFAVVGLVVGLVVGFYAFSSSAGLKGAITPSTNTLDSQALTNELNLIVAPEVGWLATSTTFSSAALGPVGSTTSTASTTFTLTGAVLGDYIEFGESTSTNGVNYSCFVNAANSVECYQQNLAAGQTPATTTVNVLDLPKATFVSPTGL